MMIGAIFTLAACQNGEKKVVQVAVQEDTTFLTGKFFLVRHSEKFPGYDSSLTEEGMQRSGNLYWLLKDSGIQKIYTTRFVRTIQTADSLRIYKKLDTVFYQADTTGEGLLVQISKHHDWGKKLLVVGHSNTLIPIIKSLGGKAPLDHIADDDYSNIFIVDKPSQKDTKVEWVHF
ncbi:hypothetical protein COR50_21070 [Chitinophaga caeni]|uniref:Histidine phosphatase family protein n=2 Tax=Chitinophaga caeni TaxID=2029983 RepID=A0A291QZT6_9BACT|nr:hypothetical protein COR50_21070 [Chitinophaga caeni]